jgi:diguanylate cyclase (GGDEF)-like protein
MTLERRAVPRTETNAEPTSIARGKLPLPVVLLIGVAAVAFLAVVDYFTGSELSFSVFYLAPVAYVTWYGRREIGFLIAAIAAAVWGVADVAAGARYSNAAIPVWNSLVRLAFFAIVVALLDALHSAHTEQHSLARTDSTTGLANGHSFEESVTAEIARSARTGRPFSLAYIDLDNFKEVNDTLGHGAGDELLGSIAAGLLAKLRALDVVARLGGDEFGLLLPETDDSQVAVVLERVMRAVADAVAANGMGVQVGATIGAAVFVTPPKDVHNAIRIADALMYEGKRLGRGRVVIHCR